MAHHRRLRRLAKKMNTANLSDQAKALYFDLIYPPIYADDLDEEQVKKRRRSFAVNWVKRWWNLFLVEQNSHDKPLTYLNNFADEHNQKGARIASRLVGWENYESFREIAQEKIKIWDIKESEYKDGDPITADIEKPSPLRNN